MVARALRLFVLMLAAVAVVTALASCGGEDQPDSVACGADGPPAVDDGLDSPQVIRSEDGVLETSLEASYGPVELAGEPYETLNFGGSVPGPTFVVCPGDKLVVEVSNNLEDTPASWDGAIAHGEKDVPHGEGQLTNLHTHGFHVSPKLGSDNVYISIAQDESFTYTYEIPEDHPPGMYWYHAHRHGFVDEQIYAGMLGGLYVAGGLDDLPELADVPTRTMLIHSLELGDDGAVVPSQKAQDPDILINGQLDPELEIGPGEQQRWQILNGTSDSMIKLGLDGHQFEVLANDGNTLVKPVREENLLLGPGERREVLVTGGEAGSYKLRSLEFEQSQGTPTPEVEIATLASGGDDGAGEFVDLSEGLTAPQEDLRDATVDTRHRVVYTSRGSRFFFNGKVFDENRIDETMKLDEVAEWKLVNRTSEWHTFHIHINDFQIVAAVEPDKPGTSRGRVRDVPLEAIDPEDTLKIPPGGTVTMRTRPIDFTGKFVYHCHMVFHEDHGMMANVEVVE